MSLTREPGVRPVFFSLGSDVLPVVAVVAVGISMACSLYVLVQYQPLALSVAEIHLVDHQ